MSIIGSDRSGPRIQCNVFKESGACDNAARYYVQKIEGIVIGALREQLSNPALIREYVKAFVRSAIEPKPKRGVNAPPLIETKPNANQRFSGLSVRSPKD